MAQSEGGGGPPRDSSGNTPERRKTPRSPAPVEGPGPAAYAGFGLQFVIALLVFLYLGQWVDRKFDTAPVFLLIGVFAGAGGAFYSLYRKLTAAQRREDKAREEQKGK